MTTSGAHSTRRLLAPYGSDQTLLDPPREAIAERIEENRSDASRQDASCGGSTLGELSRSARSELLQLARRYTSQYRDPGSAPGSDTESNRDQAVFVAGHQPQLFHVGVWFKNFLLADLGRRHRATCVNLLIDNDTCRATTIRVPTGSLDAPRIATVPYDRPGDPVPYEERPVRDRRVFETFATRVTESFEPLVSRSLVSRAPVNRRLTNKPLVDTLWKHAMRALATSDNLGQSIAQARNCLEADWGLDNLELPFSHVCRTRSFHEFLVHLLIHADRLREVYNRCLGKYRRLNRIRSRSHPVPSLDEEDGWCESPFWIWSREHPQRGRLFVRRTPAGLELTDRRDLRRLLSFDSDSGSDAAVEQLGNWEDRGIRIRPRALITTMFARLVLSDLFVHGIGGAKYDELTDAIIEGFFGVRPPNYVVATATIRLPLDLPPLDAQQRLRNIDRQIRELQYHPEKFLPLTPDTRPLVEAKRKWITQQLPQGQRKPRHDAICASNEALQPYVRDRRRACLEDRRKIASELRRERLLSSREFSFCLFPADGLRKTLLELSRQEP